MSKIPKSLLVEYEDIYPMDSYGLLNEEMPMAGVWRQLINPVRLLGREAERTAANIIGHSKRIGKAAVDTVNPFMSVSGMASNSREQVENIEKTLAAIDERYPDVIAALWQTAQLTDVQAFLFMLNPSLYLGSKTFPKTLNFTVDALSTISGNRNNLFARTINRSFGPQSAIAQATRVGGPMANQPASAGGGGYGYGDYGGYGGYGGDGGGGGD